MDGGRGKEGIALAGVSPDREPHGRGRVGGRPEVGRCGVRAVGHPGASSSKGLGLQLQAQRGCVTRPRSHRELVVVCGERCGSDSSSQAPLCTAWLQVGSLWSPGHQVRGGKCTPPPAPACHETQLLDTAASGSPVQPARRWLSRSGLKRERTGTAGSGVTPRPHPPGTRSSGAFLATPPPPPPAGPKRRSLYGPRQ